MEGSCVPQQITLHDTALHKVTHLRVSNVVEELGVKRSHVEVVHGLLHGSEGVSQPRCALVTLVAGSRQTVQVCALCPPTHGVNLVQNVFGKRVSRVGFRRPEGPGWGRVCVDHHSQQFARFDALAWNAGENLDVAKPVVGELGFPLKACLALRDVYVLLLCAAQGASVQEPRRV